MGLYSPKGGLTRRCHKCVAEGWMWGMGGRRGSSPRFFGEVAAIVRTLRTNQGSLLMARFPSSALGKGGYDEVLLSPVQCPPSEAREGKRSEPTTTIPSWYRRRFYGGECPSDGEAELCRRTPGSAAFFPNECLRRDSATE